MILLTGEQEEQQVLSDAYQGRRIRMGCAFGVNIIGGVDTAVPVKDFGAFFVGALAWK